jgi:hypothetical protein
MIMIESSKEIKGISKALLEAQPKIDVALKTQESHYGKYADLFEVIKAIKEPLNEAGVLIMQSVDMATSAEGVNSVVIITSLIHPSTGEYFCSNTPVFCQSPNDPQKLGSGITYAKRYGLQAFGLLPSEDDDGKGASKRPLSFKPPTEAEQKVIDAICKDLPEKEGFIVNNKKISGIFFAKTNKYPSSMKSVKGAAQWVMDNCSDTEIYIEQE